MVFPLKLWHQINNGYVNLSFRNLHTDRKPTSNWIDRARRNWCVYNDHRISLFQRSTHLQKKRNNTSKGTSGRRMKSHFDSHTADNASYQSSSITDTGLSFTNCSAVQNLQEFRHGYGKHIMRDRYSYQITVNIFRLFSTVELKITSLE